VPFKGDNEEERAARIDMILEELRLNTEDMRELAKQALERARRRTGDARSTLDKASSPRAGKKR
jgi:hypothetical protein